MLRIDVNSPTSEVYGQTSLTFLFIFSPLPLPFCLPHRLSNILAKQVFGLLPILSLCSKEAFIFPTLKTWPENLAQKA